MCKKRYFSFFFNILKLYKSTINAVQSTNFYYKDLHVLEICYKSCNRSIFQKFLCKLLEKKILSGYHFYSL